MDFATMIPVRVLGSPPTADGISRKSGSPAFTLLAASQERKALFTST